MTVSEEPLAKELDFHESEAKEPTAKKLQRGTIASKSKRWSSTIALSLSQENRPVPFAPPPEVLLRNITTSCYM